MKNTGSHPIQHSQHTFYLLSRYEQRRHGPSYNPLLPLGRGGVLWQVLGVRDEFTALHVRLQNLGYTESLLNIVPKVSKAQSRMPERTRWVAYIGSLVVLNNTAQCSFSGTQSSVEHVYELDGLSWLSVTVSDVQPSRF